MLDFKDYIMASNKKKETKSYSSSKTKKVYNLSNLTSDELFDLLESISDNTDVDDELEGDFEDNDCVADLEFSFLIDEINENNRSIGVSPSPSLIKNLPQIRDLNTL
ncbi:hypothetical protein FQA39_LY16207 [Lamprigera yunnana]|nr:hypothetical protein FQA39_LY16207 [Lamprigera yunnana]